MVAHFNLFSKSFIRVLLLDQWTWVDVHKAACIDMPIFDRGHKKISIDAILVYGMGPN